MDTIQTKLTSRRMYVLFVWDINLLIWIVNLVVMMVMIIRGRVCTNSRG